MWLTADTTTSATTPETTTVSATTAAGTTTVTATTVAGTTTVTATTVASTTISASGKSSNDCGHISSFRKYMVLNTILSMPTKYLRRDSWIVIQLQIVLGILG